MSWKKIFENKDPAKIVLFAILGIFIGSIMLIIPTPGLLGNNIVIPMLGMVLMGICSPSVNITMQSLRHKIIPPDKQGRVGSVSSSASLSMIPPATILTGIITEYLGNEAIRLIIFTSSILGIIAILAVWFLTDLPQIQTKLARNSDDIIYSDISSSNDSVITLLD